MAIELINYPGLAVEMIGGRLFKHSVVTVGATVMEAIGRVRPDTYFMGVTGVHPEFGLTTGDSEEAAVKRALCHGAAETVVLASGEKLGAVSPYAVVRLDEISTIVVDGPVPENLERRLSDLDIEIVRTA